MILRAKYILPDSATTIENGFAEIAGDRIAQVGRWSERSVGDADFDFGNAFILPGLVNAHAHLELTHVRANQTSQLTTWLMQIMQSAPRQETTAQDTVTDGIQMALEGGTTTIADISASGWSTPILRASPIRAVSFHEVLGFSPRRLSQAVDRAEDALRQGQTTQCTVGLSPHAPYSVSAPLYQKTAFLARTHGRLFCSHVAESLDEVEFLRRGTGPFRAMLESLHIPLSDWSAPGLTPVHYLNSLGVLDGMLVAHGNYLEDDEVECLVQRQASVIYCPRSHLYFSHAPHPIQELLRRGVPVALGTDSLASNWSLSMLDEIRFLARRCTDLSLATVLHLATHGGAQVLGLPKVGKLQPGWQADAIVVPLDSGGAAPLEDLMASDSQSICTIVAGHIALYP